MSGSGRKYSQTQIFTRFTDENNGIYLCCTAVTSARGGKQTKNSVSVMQRIRNGRMKV